MSKIALSGLALLILTFIAYKVRRKAPYFTFGWLWYLVTMLPMLGVLQISQAGMSNKYAYLPFIGLYIGVVWLIASAFSADTSETGQAEGAGWAIVLGAVAMILLTLVSWRQTGAWKNDEALFTRAVSVDPANYAAYNKLGLVYEDKKDLDKARQHYERAVSIYPTYYAAHMNLGELFMSKGLYPEAATAFEQASTSQPTNSKPLVNLANAQMYMNDSSSAEFNYGRAIEINPRDSRAHYNLAMILLSRGEDDVAIQHLTAAVQSDAQNKEAALTLGNKLFEKGRLDEALRAYRVALNADPKNLVARLNTATILQKTSRYQSALDEMRLASKHNPKNARVKTMLGEALAASQLLEQAVEAYREALKLEPGAPDATNNLAYLLATAPNPGIRNGKEAVKLALKVNTLAKFEQPGLLDTLACAYAEAGQYRKATETAAKALKIAQRAKMTELATDISQKLLFFKANRPFHYGEGQFGR